MKHAGEGMEETTRVRSSNCEQRDNCPTLIWHSFMHSCTLWGDEVLRECPCLLSAVTLHAMSLRTVLCAPPWVLTGFGGAQVQQVHDDLQTLQGWSVLNPKSSGLLLFPRLDATPRFQAGHEVSCKEASYAMHTTHGRGFIALMMYSAPDLKPWVASQSPKSCCPNRGRFVFTCKLIAVMPFMGNIPPKQLRAGEISGSRNSEFRLQPIQ